MNFKTRRSNSPGASGHPARHPNFIRERKARRNGLQGKLPDSDPVALRQGWLRLTRREKQVLALVCHPLESAWCESRQDRCLVQGGPRYLTNRQIAARLFVSPETIKTHLAHGLVKLGLHSKTELRRALAGWNLEAWEAPESQDE